MDDQGSHYRTYLNNRLLRSMAGLPSDTPDEDQRKRDRALQRDLEEENSPLGPYTSVDNPFG